MSKVGRHHTVSQTGVGSSPAPRGPDVLPVRPWRQKAAVSLPCEKKTREHADACIFSFTLWIINRRVIFIYRYRKNNNKLKKVDQVYTLANLLLSISSNICSRTMCSPLLKHIHYNRKGAQRFRKSGINSRLKNNFHDFVRGQSDI